MADEEEFEEQLEQEKLEKVEKAESESVHRGLTYTDDDGTVMEWDPTKKAYFPKIDDDFIARYQMSYGIDSSKAEGEQATTTDNQTSATADSSQAWQDYYNHYNQQGANSDPATSTTDHGDNKDYSVTDYYNYYAYYYGEDYAKEWLKSRHKEGEVSDEEESEEKKEGKEEEEKSTEEDADKKGNKKKKGKDKEGVKRKAPEEPPAWFDVDSEKSTHVYVSNLPSDISDKEFEEVMAKFGLIMFEPLTHKPKLKLYRNSDGSLKGDGLCCYIKQESVDLALKILDGSDLHGNTITVQRAKFEMKGNFDPSKKKKKLSNKAKRKLKERQEKLFDWRPDIAPGTRLRFERILILKNMFDVKEFETDPSLINDLRDDVRSECAKFGDVRKVQVHDRHPEGVITVTMGSPEEADACVAALKGRWFAKRQINAETYDGKTKYQVQETDAEKEERLRGWDTFLVSESKPAKGDNSKPTDSAKGDKPGGSGVLGSGAASASTEASEECPHSSSGDVCRSDEPASDSQGGAGAAN